MGWGFVQVRLVDDAAGNETRSLKKPEPLAVGEFANSNLTPRHGEFKAVPININIASQIQDQLLPMPHGL